ncbi:hypothetical protein HD554DRAFT_2038962 [Boletus coccyginus]|nr:hypothetical protein HD554DRAFT_2038962 [Boletus coccyginus]
MKWATTSPLSVAMDHASKHCRSAKLILSDLIRVGPIGYIKKTALTRTLGCGHCDLSEYMYINPAKNHFEWGHTWDNEGTTSRHNEHESTSLQAPAGQREQMTIFYEDGGVGAKVWVVVDEITDGCPAVDDDLPPTWPPLNAQTPLTRPLTADCQAVGGVMSKRKTEPRLSACRWVSHVMDCCGYEVFGKTSNASNWRCVRLATHTLSYSVMGFDKMKEPLPYWKVFICRLKLEFHYVIQSSDSANFPNIVVWLSDRPVLVRAYPLKFAEKKFNDSAIPRGGTTMPQIKGQVAEVRSRTIFMLKSIDIIC